MIMNWILNSVLQQIEGFQTLLFAMVFVILATEQIYCIGFMGSHGLTFVRNRLQDHRQLFLRNNQFIILTRRQFSKNPMNLL